MADGHDREEQVRAERARAIGLFRYGLIREAADPGLSTKQRGQLVRQLAEREHPGPFGTPCGWPGRRSTGGSGTGAAAGSTRWCPARGGSSRAPRRRCWSWRPP